MTCCSFVAVEACHQAAYITEQVRLETLRRVRGSCGENDKYAGDRELFLLVPHHAQHIDERSETLQSVEGAAAKNIRRGEGKRGLVVEANKIVKVRYSLLRAVYRWHAF